MFSARPTCAAGAETVRRLCRDWPARARGLPAHAAPSRRGARRVGRGHARLCTPSAPMTTLAGRCVPSKSSSVALSARASRTAQLSVTHALAALDPCTCSAQPGKTRRCGTGRHNTHGSSKVQSRVGHRARRSQAQGRSRVGYRARHARQTARSSRQSPGGWCRPAAAFAARRRGHCAPPDPGARCARLVRCRWGPPGAGAGPGLRTLCVPCCTVGLHASFAQKTAA